MKIITVDAGKYNTKALVNMDNIIFRTKFQEVDNAIFNEKTNAYHVQWKGNNYLIGDGAKEIDFDTSKQKLQHKLATYIACAQLVEDAEEIGLVILSPLSVFSHKQKREEFRQYILDEGVVDFKLNGLEKLLSFRDVTVFSEACGIAFSNQEIFQDNVVGIIDIGGLNVNGIIVDSMTPIKGTEFTVNLGSYLLMEKVRKELNKELGTNIQDYQIESIIKNGYYNYKKEESREIISSIISDHFTDILLNMKANNWDVKGLEIVVAGGGSITLGLDNIRKYIPQAQMSRNPIWDNCIGGQMVGEMIYE